MTRYEIRCTETQTRKALELGAPIEVQEYISSTIPLPKDWFPICNHCFHIPTTEEMIGWLRSKGIQFHFDDETGYWCIVDANNDLPPLRWFGYSNNKELDAIDAALEYLTNNKKSKIEL